MSVFEAVHLGHELARHRHQQHLPAGRRDALAHAAPQIGSAELRFLAIADAFSTRRELTQKRTLEGLEP